MNYNTIEHESVYAGTKLYNGNISETYWRTSSDNVKRKYSYQYDELNRLKDAVYQKPVNGNPSWSFQNSYGESLTYDKNGNVKRLFRTGEFDDVNYALEIDRLVYTYDSAKPNQLTKVIDESTNPNGFKDSANNEDDDYKYDDFGNMESDANKGITRISYNHLNLPIEITFAETKHIRYLYNAAGQKISKTVTDGSAVNITEYLDGYQYIKPGADNYKLYFFPHAEGYVNTIGGNNYVFNYTDHLGNIRLSYGLDRGVLTVLEENNYYPYGLKHENYNVSKKQYEIANSNPELVICNNCDYKYKYNGKEFQDELGLNMTAMDMRMFDSAIARWVVQDPVIHHFQSPYNGFDGNPVYWADPSGADVVETKDAYIFGGDDVKGVFSALINGTSYTTTGDYYDIQMLAIEGESGGGAGGNENIQKKIIEIALKYYGRTDYSYDKKKGNFAKDTNKCNLFVYDILKKAGLNPGLPNGNLLGRIFFGEDGSSAASSWRSKMEGGDDVSEAGSEVSSMSSSSSLASGRRS